MLLAQREHGVKFVCDRCKTRYSIGDDRVRGKILKIRCKTCENVITVREGMPSPDAVELGEAPTAPAGAGQQPYVRRPRKTTMAAPIIQSEAPAGPPGTGALGAAFASAMAKPPPALEEEWYVSVDGEQSGPFTLADAQRWVAARSPDADLHCWSEGFDDWLPVDKVSHFRGLRKKPAPAPALPRTVTPPGAAARPAGAAIPGAPSPRAASPGGVGAAPSPALRAAAPRVEPRVDPEDTPKPLFAATMASLEKGAPRAPEFRPPGSARPSATPPNGMPVGGAGPGAPAVGGLNGLRGPTSAGGKPMPANIPTQHGYGHGSKPPGGALFPPAPKPPANAFDSSELADSATQIEAPSFIEPTVAEPIAAKRASAFDQAADSGSGLPAANPSGPVPQMDDDLDIGEVSRVVKLADLARDANKRAASLSGPVPVAPRVTQSKLDVPAIPGLGEAPIVFEPMPPPPVVSNRRGMLVLIAGAIALVGVAVAVVLLFVLRSDDAPSGGGLGRVDEIDTSRPENARPTGSGGGAITNPVDPTPSETPQQPRRPSITQPSQPRVPTPGLPTTAPTPGGNALDPTEIEEMAGKNSSITQRCHMRAQRGTDGILIGDVKKVSVTLTINAAGQVTDASLSDGHNANTFGKCLIGAMRTWKFRPSPGGTFRFVLHFG